MSQDLNLSACSSLVIFMYWACENHTSNATPTEKLQQILSFLQWTASIARSFCEGCTWQHLHILVKAPLCCDWKGQGASAQSFTLWHQTTIKTPCRAHLTSACLHHMAVVLHVHPVCGESHIHHNANWEAATLAARLGKIFEIIECERDKLNANWGNLDINNLQSNLLKQHWTPFSNFPGAIS